MATIDGWVNLPSMSSEEVAGSAELRRVLEFFGLDTKVVLNRTVGDLLGAMDEAGMEHGVLAVRSPGTQGGGRVGFRHASFEDGLKACSEAAGRLRLMVDVSDIDNPMATCRRLREALEENAAVAVLVTAAGLEQYLTDAKLYPVYALCCELDVPVVANVGIFGPPMSSKYQNPLMVEEVLCDFPELVFIAAHMGHPWESLLVRLMMKFRGLYLMTSGYSPKYLDPEVTAFANSRRGAGRLIFASDWPLLPMHRAATEARAVALAAEAALPGYLGENLQRVLRWE